MRASQITLTPTARNLKWIYESNAQDTNLVSIRKSVHEVVDINKDGKVSGYTELQRLNDMSLRLRLNILNDKYDLSYISKYQKHVSFKQVGITGDGQSFRILAGTDDKLSVEEIKAHLSSSEVLHNPQQIVGSKSQKAFKDIMKGLGVGLAITTVTFMFLGSEAFLAAAGLVLLGWPVGLVFAAISGGAYLYFQSEVKDFNIPQGKLTTNSHLANWYFSNR